VAKYSNREDDCDITALYYARALKKMPQSTEQKQMTGKTKKYFLESVKTV